MFSKMRQGQMSNREGPGNSRGVNNPYRKKKKGDNVSYSGIYQTRKETQCRDMDFTICRSSSCLFQGKWAGAEKRGEGVLMRKDGLMLIGKWERDLLNGAALVFPPFGGIFKAQFLAGRLNGWVAYKYSHRMYTFTRYFEDKVDGDRISYDIDEGIWAISRLTADGKFQSLTHVEQGSKHQLPSFIDGQELEDLIQQFIIHENYLAEFSSFHQQRVSTSIIYLGAVSEQRVPEGLGIAFSDHEAFIGNFNEGILNEYGRMKFSNGLIYHGSVKNGQIQGQGIYYSPQHNQTTIMNSQLNEEPSKVEEYNGYINIDFPFPIGHHIGTCSTGVPGNALEILSCESEHSYYHYVIENKMKEENTILGIGEGESVMESYSSVEKRRKISSDQNQEKKGLSINQKGSSDDLLRESNLVNGTQVLRSNSTNQKTTNPYQNTQKQKSQKNLEDAFISIQVKENYEEKEKEKFKLQTPQENLRKSKFLSEHSNSKSMGWNSRDQGYLEPSMEESPRMEQSDSGSNISQISDKMRKIMKKSRTVRRKIFD